MGFDDNLRCDLRKKLESNINYNEDSLHTVTTEKKNQFNRADSNNGVILLSSRILDHDHFRTSILVLM